MAVDWEAILSGPPVGAVEQTGQAKAIGIPDTFVPYVKPFAPSGRMSPDQAERRGIGAAPREPYFDGAEFGPRSLSPETRARLQSAMAQAGLIGENDTYRLGVWDETSTKAYKKVLAYANQGGIDADTALDELLQSQMYDMNGLAGGLEPDPGRVTSTTSSLTLEAQVQAAAQARLGRKLRAGEVSKFAAIYQGMEGGFNSKVSSMQDQAAATGQDASVEEIPSADVAADQYIDSNFAQEEAGQSTSGYLDALRGLLGG